MPPPVLPAHAPVNISISKIAFEKLQGFDPDLWEDLKEDARAAVNRHARVRIAGSDISSLVVEKAEENAQKELLRAKESGELLLEKTKKDAKEQLEKARLAAAQEEKAAQQQADFAAKELLYREKAETERLQNDMQKKSLDRKDDIIQALIQTVVG